MKKIIYKIFDYIGQSVFSSKEGKVSSTRIASYFILGGILTTIALFIGIEGMNAVVVWRSGLSYVIPNEHIVLFGMVLAHHLTLLGINKNHETKIHQPNDSSKKLTPITILPTEGPIEEGSTEEPNEEII